LIRTHSRPVQATGRTRKVFQLERSNPNPFLCYNLFIPQRRRIRHLHRNLFRRPLDLVDVQINGRDRQRLDPIRRLPNRILQLALGRLLPLPQKEQGNPANHKQPVPKVSRHGRDRRLAPPPHKRVHDRKEAIVFLVAAGAKVPEHLGLLDAVLGTTRIVVFFKLVRSAGRKTGGDEEQKGRRDLEEDVEAETAGGKVDDQANRATADDSDDSGQDEGDGVTLADTGEEDDGFEALADNDGEGDEEEGAGLGGKGAVIVCVVDALGCGDDGGFLGRAVGFRVGGGLFAVVCRGGKGFLGFEGLFGLCDVTGCALCGEFFALGIGQLGFELLFPVRVPGEME